MAHAAMHASDDAHPPGRVLQHVLLQQMVPKATQLQNIAQASVGTCSLVYLLSSPLLVLCADRGTSSTRCSHSRRAETSQTCRCSASRVPVLLSLKKRKTCSSRQMTPISQANHELLACSGLQLFSRVESVWAAKYGRLACPQRIHRGTQVHMSQHKHVVASPLFLANVSKTCSSRQMAPTSQAGHELLPCSGLQLFSRLGSVGATKYGRLSCPQRIHRGTQVLTLQHEHCNASPLFLANAPKNKTYSDPHRTGRTAQKAHLSDISSSTQAIPRPKERPRARAEAESGHTNFSGRNAWHKPFPLPSGNSGI